MTAPNPVISKRRVSGGLPGFVAATLGLIGLTGAMLTLAFRGPGDNKAILVSAVAATLVQITAFRAVKKLMGTNLLAGLGAGALIRLLGLIGYAVVAGSVLGLPLPAALMSLLVFYFVSMLIEPLFLKS
jgi:hypothetical protein